MGAMLSGANQGPGGDHPGSGLRGFRLGQGPMKLGESGPLSGQKMEDLSDRDLWTYHSALAGAYADPNHPGNQQALNPMQKKAREQKLKAWKKLTEMLVERQQEAWEYQWRYDSGFPQDPGLGQMHPAQSPSFLPVGQWGSEWVNGKLSPLGDADYAAPEKATAWYIGKDDQAQHNKAVLEDQKTLDAYAADPFNTKKDVKDKKAELWRSRADRFYSYMYSDNPWGYD